MIIQSYYLKKTLASQYFHKTLTLCIDKYELYKRNKRNKVVLIPETIE